MIEDASRKEEPLAEVDEVRVLDADLEVEFAVRVDALVVLNVEL